MVWSAPRRGLVPLDLAVLARAASLPRLARARAGLDSGTR